MSAAHELPNLDADLVDLLAPEGAPSDDDVALAWEAEAMGDAADAAAERVAAWEPDDAEAADWVARKAQRAQAATDALQAQRDRLVAQADAWLERERKRHDRTLVWAMDLLGRWLEREIEADQSKKPRKSRDLPCGVRVRATAGKPKVVLTDLELFIRWAKEHAPDLLRTSDPEPDKRALAKLAKDDGDLITEDGEIALGVTVERGEDSYKIDFGGRA